MCPFRGTEGSNPSPSARTTQRRAVNAEAPLPTDPEKTTAALLVTVPPAVERPLAGELSAWLQFGVAVAQSVSVPDGALATAKAGCARWSDPIDVEM